MEHSTACPCGTGQALADCCAPYHAGLAAPTAERLMRSRYSAYVLGLIDYLKITTLPAQQSGLDLEAMAHWSQSSHWLGLKVEESQDLGPDRASVRFQVRWQEATAAEEHCHQECSTFVYRDQRWYFIDPTVLLKPGRNDPCPCLSGQKFKKCCASYLS